MSSALSRSPGTRTEPNTLCQAQLAPGAGIWAPLMGISLAMAPTGPRLQGENI